MTKILALAIAALTLAACGTNAAFEYEYPRSPKYQRTERSQNYWKHGEQYKKETKDCNCEKKARNKPKKK